MINGVVVSSATRLRAWSSLTFRRRPAPHAREGCAGRTWWVRTSRSRSRAQDVEIGMQIEPVCLDAHFGADTDRGSTADHGISENGGRTASNTVRQICPQQLRDRRRCPLGPIRK